MGAPAVPEGIEVLGSKAHALLVAALFGMQFGEVYTSLQTKVVDGQENADAAWYYPTPKDAAKQIANHVAFWRGVTVEK